MLYQNLTKLKLSELAAWSPPEKSKTADEFLTLLQQMNLASSKKYALEDAIKLFISKTDLYRIICKNRGNLSIHPGILTWAVFKRLSSTGGLIEDGSSYLYHSDADLWAERFVKNNEDLKCDPRHYENIKEFYASQCSFNCAARILKKVSLDFENEFDKFMESLPEAEFYASVGNMLSIELGLMSGNDFGKKNDPSIMSIIEQDVLNKISGRSPNALRFYLSNHSEYSDILADNDKNLNLLSLSEAIFERKTGLSPVSWRRGWTMAANHFGGEKVFSEVFLSSLRGCLETPSR